MKYVINVLVCGILLSAANTVYHFIQIIIIKRNVMTLGKIDIHFNNQSLYEQHWMDAFTSLILLGCFTYCIFGIKKHQKHS